MDPGTGPGAGLRPRRLSSPRTCTAPRGSWPRRTRTKALRDKYDTTGYGYGTGHERRSARLAGPRGADAPNKVTYPFRQAPTGGSLVDRQTTGGAHLGPEHRRSRALRPGPGLDRGHQARRRPGGGERLFRAPEPHLDTWGATGAPPGGRQPRRGGVGHGQFDRVNPPSPAMRRAVQVDGRREHPLGRRLERRPVAAHRRWPTHRSGGSRSTGAGVRKSYPSALHGRRERQTVWIGRAPATAASRHRAVHRAHRRAKVRVPGTERGTAGYSLYEVGVHSTHTPPDTRFRATAIGPAHAGNLPPGCARRVPASAVLHTAAPPGSTVPEDYSRPPSAACWAFRRSG